MAMNNVINISDGGGCVACPPPGCAYQVRVQYRDAQTPDSVWSPVTIEVAGQLLVQFAARADVAQATIEPNS